MKIELNSYAETVLVCVAICASIVGGILGIGWMIYDHNVKLNQAIASAKTCEEAVLLEGGADATSRLVACKLHPDSPVAK